MDRSVKKILYTPLIAGSYVKSSRASPAGQYTQFFILRRPNQSSVQREAELIQKYTTSIYYQDGISIVKCAKRAIYYVSLSLPLV